MASFSPFGCDPEVDPTCLTQPPPIVTIVVDTGVAAEVGGVAALAGATADAVNVIKSVAGLILRALTTVLSLAALIWTSILKPLLAALKKVLDAIRHISDKILRPYLDWMRQMRKIILDLYNRFVRPIIVVIESLRRIIHFFQLLHIHIFDRLDRALARIERKILTPIYFALYRLNTLGNWVSFILNVKGYITRGLLLGSLTQQRGGFVNTFYEAQTWGYVPPTPASGSAPALPITTPQMFTAAAASSFSETIDITGDPTGDLARCLSASLPTSLGEGDPTGEMLNCLWRSITLNV